ncbi:MAG TPA: NAD(P)H-dependent oxidoreductase subunit E [Candidatus Limnocylindrales bacterium]|nr:NAD(P)H-dependent oxidoreductase subunit E [Candidatus Limnocylindrales bacterium]
MDLHLTSDRASDAEKSAVDGELGKPVSGWEGGRRAAQGDGHVAVRSSTPRDSLLPVLHAVNSRIGWVSRGAMNYIALRMNLPPAEIFGVASFYAMFSLEPRPPVVIHVCDDIACMTRGALALCSAMENQFGPAGSQDSSGRATWRRSPCLGLCERAPAALLSVAGEVHGERVLAPATPETIQSSLNEATNGHLLGIPDSAKPKASVPQAGSPQLRLLRRIGQVDPSSADGYTKLGGYHALRKAIEIGPEAIVREVIESKLLGRGGAAFPTGKKWEALLQQRGAGRTHYVICNADESEPGTFKDRVVMEGDPFAVLEGMAIAAVVVGAQKGYIYIRGEYPQATLRMESAIKSARAKGFLGAAILGSKYKFDIELRRGAGAYICGEETALFNSIEGFRGEPRNKPPFPTQAGLFRHPTVVNNVETLINIPEIILGGGAAYARIGTANSSGYRLFCLSGHVAHPGIYEVAFGATLRNLIDLAGGVSGTGRLQAILLGGAAGAFVSPKELDTPLTFEGTRAIGATLGSGVVMLFDDSVDVRQVLLRITEFFREETCGQCVPCRVGTMRQAELLHRLVAREPLGSVAQEINLLKEMAQAMRDASICGLGQTASSALLSAMDRWSLFS